MKNSSFRDRLKALFVLVAICIGFVSCSQTKDNIDKNTEDASDIEIYCCKSDLNNPEVQPRLAIISKDQLLITYCYPDEPDDYASYSYYFDKTLDYGFLFVCGSDQLGVYTINSDGQFDNTIFDVEYLETSTTIREFNYNWLTDEIALNSQFVDEASRDIARSALTRNETSIEANTLQKQTYMVNIWADEIGKGNMCLPGSIECKRIAKGVEYLTKGGNKKLVGKNADTPTDWLGKVMNQIKDWNPFKGDYDQINEVINTISDKTDDILDKLYNRLYDNVEYLSGRNLTT